MALVRLVCSQIFMLAATWEMITYLKRATMRGELEYPNKKGMRIFHERSEKKYSL